jgi:hypothetical protein
MAGLDGVGTDWLDDVAKDNGPAARKAMLG